VILQPAVGAGFAATDRPASRTYSSTHQPSRIEQLNGIHGGFHAAGALASMPRAVLANIHALHEIRAMLMS
jgi:hypothetical protein